MTIGLPAHGLVRRTESIPQPGEFTLGIPLQEGRNRVDPDMMATLGQQPRDFPGRVSAQLEQGRLVLQAQGWPADAVGRKVALYPEQNEVIAAPAETHPRARTGWQGEPACR